MPSGMQAKQTAKERIFRALRTGRETTRQEIAAELDLSMPTVLQNVTELLRSGILEECGSTESSGGRKARKLRLRAGAGCVLGVNITIRRTEAVAADLLGRPFHSMAHPLPFRDAPEWYDAFGQALEEFVRGTCTAEVLGAGVSFPGITDDEQILRSHIFGLSHMGLERFRRCIPFPSVFENDANCACRAERRTEHDSCFYVSLNETVGGAVMLNGQLQTGSHFQAGEVGHMLLYPGGRTCYCGKKGCADAYLSPKALVREGETVGAFFRSLAQGDPSARERWDAYAEALAILLTNLRMLYDMDLMIGGEVGAYIGPQMPEICKRAAAYDRFARDIDYLLPCACREHACAAGAAKLALDRFGSRSLEERRRNEQ